MNKKKKSNKEGLIPDDLVKVELNKLLDEINNKIIKYPMDKILPSSKIQIEDFISQIPNKPNGYFVVNENGWTGSGLEWFKVIASYANTLP